MPTKRKLVASDDGVAISLEAMANAAGNAGDASAPRPPPGEPVNDPPRDPVPIPDPDPDQEDEPDLPDEDDPDVPDEDEPTDETDAEVDELLARDDSFHFAEPPTHPAPAAARGTVRYEARIQILDAWQYPGGLKDAPDWIDRNWVAYAADEDSLRNIPAGPCLRVPLASGEVAICRIGDFVAMQEIRLVADQPGDVRVEVWPQEQFFKLFMPVTTAMQAVPEKPHRPFMSGVTATIEHEPDPNVVSQGRQAEAVRSSQLR